MSALLEKLLRIAEVEATTGLDRSTIYRKLNEEPPGFPWPIRLSPGGRSVAWKSSEIQAWIEARAAKGREEWRANRPQAKAQAKRLRAAAAVKGAR